MAEYNDAMTYKSRFHLICSCYRLPEDGSFTVGQEYAFSNTIDAVEIVDALGQVMVFPEKIFESYFCDFADPVYPVTSLGPIDKTIYELSRIVTARRNFAERNYRPPSQRSGQCGLLE